ncbi:MAG: hypothetical protein ACLFSA_10315 [Spirochaetaceae bacterium]
MQDYKSDTEYASTHNAGQKPERHIEEDEINLLDLFVVLLKYRRLILGITLLALVAAVGGYFVYPQYQYNKAHEESSVESHIVIATNSLIDIAEVDYSLRTAFESPVLLISALREAGYEKFGYEEESQVDLEDQSQRSRAIQFVKQRMVENEDKNGETLNEEQRLYTAKESSGRIELSYKNRDPEKAEAFLQALYEGGNEKIKERILPRLEVINTTYGKFSGEQDLDATGISDIMGDLERREAAERLLSEDADMLTIEEEPYISEPFISLDSFQSSFKVKGVVLVIAALFLSVFLAFVLNAIDNVRSDDESMTKIRDALRSSRSRRAHPRGREGSR